MMYFYSIVYLVIIILITFFILPQIGFDSPHSISDYLGNLVTWSHDKKETAIREWTRLIAVGILLIPLFVYRNLLKHRNNFLEIIRTADELKISILGLIKDEANHGSFKDRDHVGEKLKLGLMHEEVKALFEDIKDRYERNVQEPVSNLMQIRRMKLLHTIKFTAQSQRITLYLGILFTFIGLTLAVQEISSGSLGENSVNATLNGLGLAFITSICGLIATLAIMLFSMPVEKKLENALQAMSELPVVITKLFLKLQLTQTEITALAEVRSDLRLTASSYSQTNKMILDAMDHLKETKDSFESQIEEMRSKQITLLKLMTASFQELSTEHIRDNITEGVLQGSQVLSKQSESTARTTEKLCQASLMLAESANRVDDRLNKIQRVTDESAKHLDNKLNKIQHASERTAYAAEQAKLKPFSHKVYDKLLITLKAIKKLVNNVR